MPGLSQELRQSNLSLTVNNIMLKYEPHKFEYAYTFVYQDESSEDICVCGVSANDHFWQCIKCEAMGNTNIDDCPVCSNNIKRKK